MEHPQYYSMFGSVRTQRHLLAKSICSGPSGPHLRWHYHILGAEQENAQKRWQRRERERARTGRGKKILPLIPHLCLIRLWDILPAGNWQSASAVWQFRSISTEFTDSVSLSADDRGAPWRGWEKKILTKLKFVGCNAAFSQGAVLLTPQGDCDCVFRFRRGEN